MSYGGRGGEVGHVIFSLHLGVGHSVLLQLEGVGHVFSNHHTCSFVNYLSDRRLGILKEENNDSIFLAIDKQRLTTSRVFLLFCRHNRVCNDNNTMRWKRTGLFLCFSSFFAYSGSMDVIGEEGLRRSGMVDQLTYRPLASSRRSFSQGAARKTAREKTKKKPWLTERLEEANRPQPEHH